MRKPRDYDAELKALEDKARELKTRKVQQLGELVIATGADALTAEELAGALTDDDRAMIYGALLWIAEKLNSEDAARARELWAGKGKEAFEAERAAQAHDRSQTQQDRA
nr:conjugal transfer protein TraD [Paracoccus denitrificans]